MSSGIAASPVARFLLVTAAFIVVVAGMKAAESMLVPFLLSLFIAVICSPPMAWMYKKGVPYIVALLLIIAVIVVFGVMVGAIVGSSITSFSQDLPEYQVKLQALTTEFLARLESWGVNLDNQLEGVFDPGSALKLAGTTLASLGNVMGNAFLILLTVIFILAEETVFNDKLKAASQSSDKTLAAIGRFTTSVNQYMAIKTVMSLLTGLVVCLWLWILGVDYPVLWGTLAFLLNFVPTFGSILAAVPAVLLALIQLNPFTAMLAAAGFLAVNVVVGNFLEPRYMGKGLDLSPLVVFLSLVFWGWILGPVGMLLSVPLTMTVKIAFESFEDTRGWGVMMGSGAGLEVAKEAVNDSSTSD